MQPHKGVKAALANVTLPPSARRDSKQRTTRYTKQGPAMKASKGGKLKRKR